MERTTTLTDGQLGTSPAIVTSALILLIFIYVGRIQELHPILSQLYLGKITIGVVFLLFLNYKDKLPTSKPLLTYPQGRYLVAISALALMSIPGSIWPGQSFGFVFSFYWKLLLFVYLIFRLVNSEDSLRKMCWGITLSNFILCSAAFLDPKYVDGRLTASYTYDPNDLSLLLVMCLPITYFLMREAHGGKKVFLLVMILFSLFIIPQTGSRGGLLALATVIFALVVKQGWKKALIILPLSGGLLFFLLSVAAPQHFERFISLSDIDNDYNVSARGGRIDIWKTSLQLMKENPIFGSGAGAFVAAEGHANTEEGKWMTAHNSFLQIGVELGVVALFLHLSVIWKMIRLSRQHSTWLGPGIEIGLYAYCVGGFFLSWAYGYVVYLFIALSLANTSIDEQGPKQQCEA